MTIHSDKAMIRVLDINITDKIRMTFMEIDDMKQEKKTTAKETVPEPEAKKAASETKAAPKKARRVPPHRFNDGQKADIIRRYKAGEGPKAISESLGCSRSLITHIIRDAGAVESRTGAHLNKGREKAAAQEPIPEPVQEADAEIMETDSERDKRLKKERIAWQQAHPNKWS